MFSSFKKDLKSRTAAAWSPARNAHTAASVSVSKTMDERELRNQIARNPALPLQASIVQK
jgi:hypothetical protein